MNYWKIFCMEDNYPGLWPRWFKNQCVAVGWHAKWGFPLDGKSPRKAWTEARNCLKRIQEGDFLVVQLAHNRVGRIGEVIRKNVGDQEWQPLVPPSKEEVDGEMGRRILVRWDLTIGPFDPDMVVELPPSARLPSTVIRADNSGTRSDNVSIHRKGNGRRCKLG